jgi:peptidoglycan/xylan/chitin deacetylase (PgdA/CDA1 family)
MKGILSLMYHDVLDNNFKISGFQNPEAIKYKIQKENFEEQIGAISRKIETNHLKRDKIFLTFDDGGNSFTNIIAPILEKYGLKGYFFITTKFINEDGFISEKDIIELDKRGHFIGIHSHSHPANISLLQPEHLKFEWEQSLKILNKILRKDILYASIPGGFFSKSSLSVLSENGIKFIFTSDPKLEIKEAMGVKIIGRFPITKNIGNHQINSLMRPYSFLKIKKIARWNALKFIKKILGRHYFLIKKLYKLHLI